MEKGAALEAFGDYFASKRLEADRRTARKKLKDGSDNRSPETEWRKPFLERYDAMLEIIEPLLGEGDSTPKVTIGGEHDGRPVEVELSLSVVRSDSCNMIIAHWQGQPPGTNNQSKTLYHGESIDRESLLRRMSAQRTYNVNDILDELEWSVLEYTHAAGAAQMSQVT